MTLEELNERVQDAISQAKSLKLDPANVEVKHVGFASPGRDEHLIYGNADWTAIELHF